VLHKKSFVIYTGHIIFIEVFSGCQPCMTSLSIVKTVKSGSYSRLDVEINNARPLRRVEQKLKDNIKESLMHLAYYHVQWWALVLAVLNPVILS
jgi:hypothetical protein